MQELELERIYHWYSRNHKNDKQGQSIDEQATFLDLFDALDHYRDIYSIIGTMDSLIRERLFERLANIMQTDYSYIYNQWLSIN